MLLRVATERKKQLFRNEEEWEEEVKKRSKEEALRGLEEDVRTSVSAAAKSLCMPLEQPRRWKKELCASFLVSLLPPGCCGVEVTKQKETIR